jgi:hypothetical protein
MIRASGWRGIAAGLGLCLLPAPLLQCTSWRVQGIAPAALITEQHPGKVRIRRADSTVIVLDQPRIEGDSIIGRKGAVAVADATAIGVRKFDTLKTLGLVLAIPVAAAIVCAATECLDLGLDSLPLF